ncbi:class I SAM-dependent methyltransferase [Clostridium sp. 'deep sea']|uniref:class I SAM-dependent methyltransferase n=1 Tax=Clostridium sp. 'deep sea' TaxID=2779445 RepID=UPI00189683C0|nr:class I SAM-dependent methyltransferase [Clostridium sp. 'deep sea']QOR34954.1 class I SAM-dependent methyltransferase [Clostridium sp. 'deep sea']
MRNNMYDVETYIADIYDQIETGTKDVILLKKLIKNNKYKILEPFCGTGRISIPLALDEHVVTGLDKAKGMLDWFKLKIVKLNINDKVELICQDVIQEQWPVGFDLVLLACNCFYELATPVEQESCIKKAAKSLKAGGYLYVDNDHMEGDLAKNWQDTGITHRSICGTAQDGSIIESTRKLISFNVKKRICKFERYCKVVKPNKEVIECSYIQQKHPVSTAEVQGWLLKNGFRIINHYGNYNCEPYQHKLPRSIFWAVKI